MRRLTLTSAFGGRVFDKPIELGVYPGGRFFVAEQDGLVRLVTADGRDAGMLLDLSGRVTTQDNEEGLLSVQLAPGFPSPPHLYAYYAAAGLRRTMLSRFMVSGDAAGSEQVLLEVRQPYGNHKGGAIRFGRDGMLYLGLSDGSSGGDPHGNGQNLGTHLDKILRLDVRGGDDNYAVPPATRSWRRAAPALRSGPTACATPGAWPSTSRPACCEPATSARTPSRRST
ncbi:MAG: PQQ-dependent sugar dehydrogenase [Chloroflexi bacterium]|nr:PQQ-dependent sugar dehydrogenase [Chloroflexota bacterium]